ncbi:MAG: PilZ domain-containing protein [bacterium]
MDKGKDFNKLRHARMKIDAAVHILCRGKFWVAEMLDISATGIKTTHPADFTLAIGDHCILDVVIDNDATIHVEGIVKRVSEETIGFEFEHIPEDQEVPLWEFLGSFADAKEMY